MSKFWVVLLSIGLLACARSGSQLSSSSEESSDSLISDLGSRRIYGGFEISPENDLGRSVVAILSADSGLCTGTLIHPKVVLTAAHCLSKKVSDLKVHFGTKLQKGQSISRPVLQAIAHPQFSNIAKKDRHDIALLILEQDAPEGFTPVRMDGGALEIGAQDSLLGMGFGINRILPGIAENQRGAGQLRQVSLEVLNPAFSKSEISFKQGMNEGGICSGDSGGPMFRKLNGESVVSAVISRATGVFGVSCVVDSIATRVDTYQQWVHQNLTNQNLEIEP